MTGSYEAMRAEDETRQVREENRALRALLTQVEAERDTAQDVLRWLVDMDDPASVEGAANRRTVTLTQIIERAATALGVQP